MTAVPIAAARDARVPAPMVLRVVANGFLFFVLFPFVSPVPIHGVDAQLWPVAWAMLGVATAWACGWTEALWDRRTMAMAAVGWFYLFYVRWDLSTFDGLWVRRCATLLIGVVVFAATRQLHRLFDYRTVAAAVAVYLLAGAAQRVAPGSVNGLIGAVMGELRFALDNDRGITSLTPEPSYFAGVLALCLWMPRLLGDAMARVPRWLPVAVGAACTALVVASGSFLGVVLVSGMVGIEILQSSWRVGARRLAIRLALVAVAAVVALQLAASSTSNARAVAALRNATTDPMLIVQDPSLHMRVVGLVLGAQALQQAPFGGGNVDMDPEVADRGFSSPFFAAAIPDQEIFQEVYNYAFYIGLTEMGRGLQRMGLLYLVVLGILLSRFRGFAGGPALGFWFFALLTQNSLMTSTLWLAMGLAVERRGASAPAGRPT